ncbi:MAG TPA: hypothetical protein VGM06_16905 [Polyangiaceae bacterium]|jgi:hypothetical protein
MQRNLTRTVFASIGAASPLLAWLVGGSTTPACGGTSGTKEPVALVPALVDPGSGPVDCTVANPYDMTMIEDFEFGAATGWYTNNEVCYPWTQAKIECADAGVVCFPGPDGLHVPACSPDGGLPQVWSSCYGTGQVDCNDIGDAMALCQQECLTMQTSPPFLADQLPASIIPGGGRCGSLYGLHVVAGPFSNWGGNLGTRFPEPVDATSYDGIAVWMRTAPGFANSPRITVSDPFTDSQVNMYPAPDASAYCQPNVNCASQMAAGNTNCYNIGCDTFGQYAPLTEDWRLFVLSFDDMRQGGWGKQRPSLDLSQILSIQISYPVGTWDFWIDDIAFYRQKPAQ